MTPDISTMATRLRQAAGERQRFIVALAGPPGAGKSFLSTALCQALNEQEMGIAEIVPMDGYHFDNAVIEPAGLLPVKGAPETFDVDGLVRDLERIRASDRDVAVPVFDRPLDLARAGGRIIQTRHRIVLVEGNYLLLDKPPWTALAPLFDRTIFIDVPEDVIEERLIQRWLDMGQDREGAEERARFKDMINMQLVNAHSVTPDVIWR